MSTLVGASGARYRLDGAPAAVGGEAIVYRALAEDDGQPVAVKVAQAPGADGAWLLAEARLLGELGADPRTGPLVAPVWDEGVWADRPFVVMDWYPATLASWCAARPPEDRLGALRALVDVVSALHAAGRVHGDLKPANVLVRDEGEGPALLLADFAAGRAAFSPGYAPPEQVAGGPPDPAWDRHALAATVWRCVAGALPGDPAAFDRALPGRADLRQALEALLSPDPAARPRDLAALRAALAGAPPRPDRRAAPVAFAVLAVALAVLPALVDDPDRPCPDGFAPRDDACVHPDGRRVVRVRGGRFRMGHGEEDAAWAADAAPRDVVLTHDFWMMDAEVTQREWAAVMRTAPVETRVADYDGLDDVPCASWLGRSLVDPDLPVVCVGWDDAVAFANARSVADGLAPAYRVDGGRVTWDRDADGWRLPTEAEWERAARAGIDGPWGGAPSRDALCGWGNVRDAGAMQKWGNEIACDDGAPVLARVRSFRPNPWGLYDMLGNAIEWVWDRYAFYDPDARVDPVADVGGTARVMRGASWNHVAKGVAARYAQAPAVYSNVNGFRLVRTVP